MWTGEHNRAFVTPVFKTVSSLTHSGHLAPSSGATGIMRVGGDGGNCASLFIIRESLTTCMGYAQMLENGLFPIIDGFGRR